MSMPTPSNHRLPQPPPTPPKKTDSGPSDQSSVLERLKAARPKAAAPIDQTGSTGTTTTTPASQASPPAEAAPQDEPPAERAEPAAERAKKAKAASAAASSWVAKSGKQTASWTATTSRSAAANVRSWRPDQVRRNLVTLAVIGTLVGTASAVGLFGGPEIRNSDLLGPGLSFVSPSLFSLYLWALIALGMVGYAVHQWLPSQLESPRHRRLGWVVIASLLLNLGLALSIQADLYVFSLVLHALLLGMLLVSLRWLNRWSAATRLEGALVDVPLGLFLGWIGFTALSHTAAVLALNDVTWLTDDGFVWTMVGLGVVVIAGSAICSMDRGRIAVALAVVWGMGWIIVERLIGEPQSLPVAAITALAVFLILISAGSRRHRVDHSYRRALRARQTANLPPIDLADDDEDDDEYYEDERPRRRTLKRNE
ncbi:hypothetical protein [Arthrobacter pigmenti]|uniref:hypothetical protein n=1 Tax=Arthrobacter pigmenti TaxID=271432 RepID=UPI00143AA3A2|nr:hypothetical protein [Arthrobacter pigmenti]